MAPPEHIGEVHRHGRRKGVALQPKMVRVPLYPVAQADVELAIRWLDVHWGGAVFLPDTLRELVAVA